MSLLLLHPHFLRARCRTLSYDQVKFPHFGQRYPSSLLPCAGSVAGRSAFAFLFPSPLPLARLIEYLSWTRVKLNSLAWSRQRQAKITQLFHSLSVCMSSPRASYTRYGFPSRVLGPSEPRPSLSFPSFRADSDLAPFNMIPPSCRRLS